MMRSILRSILAVLLFFVGATVTAAEPQLGKDYFIHEAPVPEKNSKITVVEFFSYQCPHCFAFSAPLHDWSQKVAEDVIFERRAVTIGHQPWTDIARTFYALQVMGNLPALDAEVFNAIHRSKVRLDKIDLIMGWLSQRKVPLMDFDKAYRSAEARSAFDRGEQLAAEYKIPSIPAMMIDGRYLVLIASDRSFDQQLAIVDSLIAQARSLRSK
ncbi:MAG TPA: thiol:disulfide interchange protein DsbA/DsbL [Steroidobacteraceae bacterium]|nr:thiol:disulfide interchange protein DsbA/DsbL [Steroidobacteraceae bacterium]